VHQHKALQTVEEEPYQEAGARETPPPTPSAPQPEVPRVGDDVSWSPSEVTSLVAAIGTRRNPNRQCDWDAVARDVGRSPQLCRAKFDQLKQSGWR
jgi:hypothetical protein